MKILLTGGTGYIAQRLLPVLLQNGHQVVCCVRDAKRFKNKYASGNIRIVECDFLQKETLYSIPNDIDIAYYLIHSMSAKAGNFEEMEQLCAFNFKERIQNTKAKQVIYLSGIVNENELSKHLLSRKNVEKILSDATFSLTTLRAGIIIGSGSASFEIVRDIVEKLPVMFGPRWLKTKCQPIAIRNVIEFLIAVIDRHETFNNSYDIGGTDILSYKEMLLRFAKIRGLKRRIFILPLITPKISSLWLYFFTATTFALAKNLVNSMKIEVICKPNNLASLFGITLLKYDQSVALAFDKTEQNLVLSSWEDILAGGISRGGISSYIEAPVNGCYVITRTSQIKNWDITLERIWAITVTSGWYHNNLLRKIWWFIYQPGGGIDMRRKSINNIEIVTGNSLDFWRVLFAGKEEKRLLLYAEMRHRGETWMEYKIDENNRLTQTLTFRPLGIRGRIYWYFVSPICILTFNKMLRNIAK